MDGSATLDLPRKLDQGAVNATAMTYIDHQGGIKSCAALKKAIKLIAWVDALCPLFLQ